MSLVDYASSGDEEESEAARLLSNNHQQTESVTGTPRPHVHPSQPPATTSPSPLQDRATSAENESRASSSSSKDKIDNTSQLASPPFEKLPDASFLLNSPISYHPINATDHSSLVSAAVSQNALRKREGNGSISSCTRTKVPRGSLPHSRNIPVTSGGQLVPPQLRGRSNVVTEDIGKLFVRKTTDVSRTEG